MDLNAPVQDERVKEIATLPLEVKGRELKRPIDTAQAWWAA